MQRPVPAFDAKTEELVSKLAIDYNLPKTKIREIIEAPFGLLSKLILDHHNWEEDVVMGIRLPYLGKFSLTKKFRNVRFKSESSSNKARIPIDSGISEGLGIGYIEE